jgi:UPF0755 protein
MKDDAEYWKDILGDDNNGDLSEFLRNPSPQKKPGGAGYGNAPAAGELPDEGRFYDYDYNDEADKNVGQGKAASGKNGVPKDRDDFDVTFDFDREYRDVPDDRMIKPRREKRTGCLGGILYAIFVICICLLLASLLWLAATDVLGLGKPDENVQVTVPEEFTIDSVTDMLHQDGLIKYKFLFKLYADFSDASEKINPGTYELNRNYDYRALVYGMSTHGGKRVEVSVTIPEGFTIKQIINLLDVNGICSTEELWDTVTKYDFNYDFLDKSTLGDKYRLEGYLFPDTYKFYVGDSPVDAINKMLKNFKSKFKAEYITRAQELGYSIRDIVNIAAMIEKEAGPEEERSTIASVIYNRLNSKNLQYLQIDATIFYAIADTGEAFSTDIDSPYNTYQVKGLPAGPIANPGIASIKAALYPKTTDYYYYALNKDHAHNFFKDFDSFTAFISSDAYGG